MEARSKAVQNRPFDGLESRQDLKVSKQNWRREGGTFQNLSPLCLVDRFRFKIIKKPNRPTEIIPDFGRTL